MREMTMEDPARWATTRPSAAWEEGSPGDPGGFRVVTGGRFAEPRFAKLISLTEGSDLPIYPKSPKLVFLRNTVFECGQERRM